MVLNSLEPSSRCRLLLPLGRFFCCSIQSQELGLIYCTAVRQGKFGSSGFGSVGSDSQSGTDLISDLAAISVNFDCPADTLCVLFPAFDGYDLNGFMVGRVW